MVSLTITIITIITITTARTSTATTTMVMTMVVVMRIPNRTRIRPPGHRSTRRSTATARCTRTPTAPT